MTRSRPSALVPRVAVIVLADLLAGATMLWWLPYGAWLPCVLSVVHGVVLLRAHRTTGSITALGLAPPLLCIVAMAFCAIFGVLAGWSG